jgi:hypothetical protein
MEGFRRVCYPAVNGGYSGGSLNRCPSDQSPCLVSVPAGQTPILCQDEPGRWAERKCARKHSKNKCRKNRVARMCPRTCMLC